MRTVVAPEGRRKNIIFIARCLGFRGCRAEAGGSITQPSSCHFQVWGSESVPTLVGRIGPFAFAAKSVPVGQSNKKIEKVVSMDNIGESVDTI